MTIHSPLRHHPAPPRNRSSRPALPPPADRAALRQAWHLSERQVADAFGVTAATVRSWEAGRTSPTGRRRAAYAAFLGGLASGLASGLNGPPAQVPRAATGDRPRQRRSDPLHHSAAAEPPAPYRRNASHAVPPSSRDCPWATASIPCPPSGSAGFV